MKRTTFEFIRRARVERAYLVGVNLAGGSSAQEHLDELAQLAATAGAEVVGRTVQGRNRVTSFSDWMKMDLEYVDRWSLGLDAKILLRTIPAVLGGRGAY